mmetsp:Transcript_116475/g.370481  ORF Transcript_116475/g.370481 Transcript_116475/m.370481 type:complete len:100 (+) Transcript_116475:310-609(+)
MAAEYRIIESEGKLVVGFDTEIGRCEEDCSVATIEDIFQIADGEDCFPLPVMATISTAERKGLLMLVYSGEDGDERLLCLVEESAHCRDELMQILQELS